MGWKWEMLEVFPWKCIDPERLFVSSEMRLAILIGAHGSSIFIAGLLVPGNFPIH